MFKGLCRYLLVCDTLEFKNRSHTWGIYIIVKLTNHWRHSFAGYYWTFIMNKKAPTDRHIPFFLNQVGTVLLSCAFLYDIFWVFVSKRWFHESVMIVVSVLKKVLPLPFFPKLILASYMIYCFPVKINITFLYTGSSRW